MKECLSAILENNEMPCWYYDKKDLKVTPSVNDGISFDTERRYRKEGARLIMECGKRMKLGHNTVATGIVYFHRFYMFQSFKLFPRYVTACCCLLLAGKVEETPKKCRDIIKTARGLLSDEKFLSFGEDPKEEVMTLERILLQTIKFDLQVEHPYNFLIKYASCFKCDKTKLEKMVQMAWNFVNDSLSTTVCLQWEPEIIAVALIHLATKLSKFHVIDWVGRKSHHLRWWDMFVADVTMEILEDICHQVLDLYQQANKQEEGTSSPPPHLPGKTSPQGKNVTSPSSTKNSSLVNNGQPKQSIDDKKLEGNPIPTLGPSEPMHYMTGYPQPMYAHTTHFAPVPTPSASIPPPPIPPYGAQYASQPPPTQPPPMHYSAPIMNQPPYHPSSAYYPTTMGRQAYCQPPP